VAFGAFLEGSGELEAFLKASFYARVPAVYTTNPAFVEALALKTPSVTVFVKDLFEVSIAISISSLVIL
jgi:hypothetical protein